MHMRTKKWAKPELAACPYYQDDATKPRGQWRALFAKDQPLFLELGCGKGVSTAAMVYDNQNVNFIAMDITSNVLGDTRRNIAKTYGDEPVENIIITRHDIEFIRNVFAPEDRIERIYINFCNPRTTRPKYAKRRLTHCVFLERYKTVLKEGGILRFKTDNVGLFDFSLEQFAEMGLEMRDLTRDLHNSPQAEGNVMTEYEKNFSEKGFSICSAHVKFN